MAGFARRQRHAGGDGPWSFDKWSENQRRMVMASEERTKEILKELREAVIQYDEEKTVEWTKIAIEEGVDPFVATMDGLAAGMIEVGELYNRKEYFVPELLMCSDALYAGLELLKPVIEASGRKPEAKGSIVLGVVEGDVHDIGKNLIKMMFEVAGWTVHDLGKDVPLDKFVEEQVKTDSDVVGLSALMTTSMVAMPEIVKKLRAKNPNVRIMLGGAPITPEVVEKYGADGYARSAGTAVDEAVRLLKMLREEELKKKK
jgi:corrinoid protein of di/trimethylamine methyltransferase